MLAPKVQNIEEYIACFPSEVQVLLQKLRKTIHEIAPEAVEKISYGIPTFKLNGKNLIHFGAFQSHIGLYPGVAAIVCFQLELKDYYTSTGSIRFPLEKPIPFDLIKEITKFVVEQNMEKYTLKK